MNKILGICLLGSMMIFSQAENVSSISAVTLAGGIIKANSTPIEKKYPRKQCPVCKGTGKYWSGDGIKQVDCGYCEPEKKAINHNSPKLQILRK